MVKPIDEAALERALQSSLGAEFLASCEVSRGPWWGFNGIQSLVLTDQNLYVFQRGLAFTASSDLAKTAQTTIPLSGVRGVSTKRRRGLLGSGEALTLHLATDFGRKTFVTKYVDRGATLITKLQDRLEQ